MFRKFASTAMWILFVRLVSYAYANCISSYTLSTRPHLPNNILASGYVNFTVQACFNASPYFQCSWKHASLEETFHLQYENCFEPTTTLYIIKCTQEDQIIETSLTAKAPVPMGSNLFTMHCTTGGSDTTSLNLSTTIYVQNCPSSLNGNKVKVESSSYEYESPGNFTCSKNYKLFNANGEYRNVSSTKCNEVAEWQNSTGVQCWTAPTVNLTTNATKHGEIVNVTEGSTISFNCTYEDVTPSGNNSVFSFNGNRTSMSKEEVYVISNVDKNNHQNKSIFCQAATDYTEVFKEEGKSETLRLNVLYRPYAENVDNDVVCNWTLGDPGNCCVSFSSNPHSTVEELILNETTTVNKSDANDYSISIQPTSVFNQFFSYNVSEVSFNHSGFYTVILATEEFEDTTNLTFRIEIFRNAWSTTSRPETTNVTPTTSSTEQPVDFLIIILPCVGGVLSILVLILVFLLVRRRQRNFKNELVRKKVTSPIYETSGNVASDSREMKSNELYGKLNDSEPIKEIKENGLYHAMNNPAMDVIEPVYQAAGSSEITSPKEEPETEPVENATALYGAVNMDKKKKKGNKNNDEKATSAAQDRNKGLYGQVNLGNKKKKKGKANDSSITNGDDQK